MVLTAYLLWEAASLEAPNTWFLWESNAWLSAREAGKLTAKLWNYVREPSGRWIRVFEWIIKPGTCPGQHTPQQWSHTISVRCSIKSSVNVLSSVPFVKSVVFCRSGVTNRQDTVQMWTQIWTLSGPRAVLSNFSCTLDPQLPSFFSHPWRCCLWGGSSRGGPYRPPGNSAGRAAGVRRPTHCSSHADTNAVMWLRSLFAVRTCTSQRL